MSTDIMSKNDNGMENVTTADELFVFLSEQFEALDRGEITAEQFPDLEKSEAYEQITNNDDALQRLDMFPNKKVRDLVHTRLIIKAHAKGMTTDAYDLTVNPGIVVGLLEGEIHDGQLSKSSALLVRMIDALLGETTHENAVRTLICEQIRRITFLQKTKLRSFFVKWDEDRAYKIITELDGLLAEMGHERGALILFYENNFKNVSHDEIIGRSNLEGASREKTKNMEFLYGKRNLTLSELPALSFLVSPPLRSYTVSSFLIPGLKSSTVGMKSRWESAITTHPFRDLGRLDQVLNTQECLEYIKKQNISVYPQCEKNYKASLSKSIADDAMLHITLLIHAHYHPAQVYEFTKNIIYSLADTRLGELASKAITMAQEIPSRFYIIYQAMPVKVQTAIRSHLINDLFSHQKYIAHVALLAALYPAFATEIFQRITGLQKNVIEAGGEKILKTLNEVCAISGLEGDLLGKTRAHMMPILEAKRKTEASKKDPATPPPAPEPYKRVKRTRDAVNDVFEQDKTPVPTPELSTHELTTLLREALAAKQLPDDVLNRAVGLSGLHDDLALGFMEAAESLTQTPWEDGTERRLTIDKNVPFNALGITEISFLRDGDNWQASIVFGNSAMVNGRPRYCNLGMIDSEGELLLDVPAAAHFKNLDQLLTTEALRLFGVLNNSKITAELLGDVRTLLGMDEYVPPPLPVKAPEPTKAKTKDDAADSAKTAEKPENPRVKNTADFQTENLATFEAFMAYLRDTVGLEIQDSYEDVALAGYELQNRIRPNKQLPVGGASVPPPESNPLAPYIEEIEFTGVAESRTGIQSLDIDPLYFHEKISDAYLCKTVVKMGDESHTIRFCIIPGRFDVYFIGVDGSTYDEDENVVFAALKNAILQKFYDLTMREYDTSNRKTSLGTKRKGPQGPWIEKVDQAVLAASQGQFPVIVTSWGKERIAEGDAASPRKRDYDMVRTPKELFEKLYAKPCDPEVALAAHCLFLRGKQFISIPGFADDEEKLPPKVWAGSNGNKRLREGYSDIAVPLTTPEQVLEAIAHAQEPIVTVGELADTALKLFEAELEGVDAGNAFAIMYYETLLEYIDPALKTLIANYGGTDLVDTMRVSSLFSKILTEAKKKNPSVTPSDIFKGFLSLKRMPLSRFEIPIKRARDYRLPYEPRKGGTDIPTARAFRESPEATPEARPNVVSIIEGNRFRISQISDRWIMGFNRSDALDHAATIQNEWSNDREISLQPRARALLVWEFEDGEIAFTYLDEARDVTDEATNTTITGAERLQAFGKVREKILKAQTENASGNHTDFNDMRAWDHSELRRLENEGVVKLEYKGRRVTGIASSKKVTRKQVVILTGEQAGYRQFATAPTSLQNYSRYIHEQGGEQPCGINYDPALAPIQELFYKELGM